MSSEHYSWTQSAYPNYAEISLKGPGNSQPARPTGQVQRMGATSQALGGNRENYVNPNSVFTAANLPWAVGLDRTKSVYKAVIPQFLYKPSFGYPRMLDIPEIRRLAATPYIEMCFRTIIDEVTAIEWDIVPKEDRYKSDKKAGQKPKPFGEPKKPTEEPEGEQKAIEDINNAKKDDEANKQTEANQPGGAEDEDLTSEKTMENCRKVRQFFDNPNCNQECFKTQLRKLLMDILTLDSGVWIKVFNPAKQMRELYVRDGGTFTMNPDIFGTFAYKADVIDPPWAQVFKDPNRSEQDETLMQVAERAAYFQYGWTTGARPTPFGTREIIYIMRNPRADSIYGRSAMETLQDIIQLLIYGVDSNLDYFNNNNIPKGVLAMEGLTQDECTAVSQRLQETMQMKDQVGNYRRLFYKMPVVGTKTDFIKTSFSNVELELISQQEWFTKIVWAVLGITPSELGFTEDSNRATEAGQSKVFKRKAVKPLLDLLENYINSQIIPEFKLGVALIPPDVNTNPEAEDEIVSGIDDVEFKFKMEDLEEDKQKFELYELQLRAGIKTKNEIRQDLGLTPIEGGNDLGNSFSFGQDKPNPFTNNEEGGDNSDIPKEKPKEAAKEPPKEQKAGALGGKKRDPKDFPADKVAQGTTVEMEHTDNKEIAQGIALDHLSEDLNYYDKLAKMEGKAATASFPMAMRPGETPSQIYRPMKYMMSEWEKEIKRQLTEVIGEPKLGEIKSIDKATIERLRQMIKTDMIAGPMKEAIRHVYYSSMDTVAKSIQRNFMPNMKTIEFMATHAMENVEDMAETLKAGIRSTLERGLMAGEGIAKLKSRITEAFDMASNRAEMIARTETINAENAGLYEGYSQSGLKGKIEWSAHIDDRTCEHCKALNGKTVDIGNKFREDGWEGFRPTRHPLCRCSISFVPE